MHTRTYNPNIDKTNYTDLVLDRRGGRGLETRNARVESGAFRN